MTGEISEPIGTGLGKILRESRFSVPNHQRDYSWGEDEVKQLFDDASDAETRGDSQYFLGLMVFMRSASGELIVLDGQQRLATAVIFFSAVRNWLRAYEQHQNNANLIQEWFIGSSELGQTKPLPRLILNSANNKAFVDYVVQQVPLGDISAALNKMKRNDRSRRLLEAVIYCHNHVAELAAAANGADAAADFLFKRVNYFRDAVSVINLTVQSENLAFTIFETLNDRGMELSPLDLVKNYLFGQASTDEHTLREMEDRWTQMMSTLSNVRSNNFLKAFWTSRHGRIRTGELFQTFKKQYSNAESVTNLSIDMLEASEQYAAIDSADDPVWAQYKPEDREIIRSMKIMGSQQVHPVILAALAKMDVPDASRLLRLLEVLIVRYILVGGGNTGRFETTCARVARMVYTKEIKTAAAAFQELKELYPPDPDFKRNFEGKQERSAQKAQYLLKCLERQAIRDKYSATADEKQPGGSLSLEHILPKNPGNEWASVLKADPALADDCMFRLGNQCLLTKKMNRQLGRKGFSEKVKAYGQSDLLTNLDLRSYTAWDRANIDKRQRDLAALAVSAWRFP